MGFKCTSNVFFNLSYKHPSTPFKYSGLRLDERYKCRKGNTISSTNLDVCTSLIDWTSSSKIASQLASVADEGNRCVKVSSATLLRPWNRKSPPSSCITFLRSS